VQSPAAARGADFAGVIGDSITGLEGLDRTAADKAVKAATGDLTDIHDYVIAATQAQTATELTTTVRNKALDAFNEIMRMPL
jgi:flagellar hook-basal body complex protein FliE